MVRPPLGSYCLRSATICSICGPVTPVFPASQKSTLGLLRR